MEKLNLNVIQNTPMVFTESNWREGYNLVRQIAELQVSEGSDIRVSITTPMASPVDKKKAERFEGVHITVNDKYIQFEDLYTLEALIEKIGDKVNKNGIGLITVQEANTVTVCPLFEDDTQIKHFKELSQFVNIKTVGNFRKSTLETIDLSNCETVAESQLRECVSLRDIGTISTNKLGFASIRESSLRGVTGVGQDLYISGYAFYNTKTLEYVRNVNVTFVEANAFYGALELKEIDLSYCTSIGYYAFGWCGKLKKLKLTCCESIGDYAFHQCGIDTLIITNGFVSIEQHQFPTDGLRDGIYVPDDLVSTYKSATNWSKWASKIKPLSSYTGEL